MFALMMFVFDGLKNCTPDMLISIIGPMVILIVTGTLGMCIFSFVIAKILKISFPLAFANGPDGTLWIPLRCHYYRNDL